MAWAEVRAGRLAPICILKCGTWVPRLIDFKTGALRDPNVLLHQGKWAYHKPKAASLSTADNEVLHEAPPAPSAVYRVKSGDTLYSIAKRNGTTVQELCRVNGIGERRPIYAGQRLRLK